MAFNAPGKHYRKGISIKNLTEMFATEYLARGWLESELWPDGPRCNPRPLSSIRMPDLA